MCRETRMYHFMTKDGLLKIPDTLLSRFPALDDYVNDMGCTPDSTKERPLEMVETANTMSLTSWETILKIYDASDVTCHVQDCSGGTHLKCYMKESGAEEALKMVYTLNYYREEIMLAEALEQVYFDWLGHVWDRMAFLELLMPGFTEEFGTYCVKHVERRGYFIVEKLFHHFQLQDLLPRLKALYKFPIVPYAMMWCRTLYSLFNQGDEFVSIGKLPGKEIPQRFVHSLIQIACGQSHIMLLTSDGLFAIGSNSSGQLGLPESCVEVSMEPVLVPMLDRVLGVWCKKGSLGKDAATMILTTQALYACGRDFKGELGLGHTGDEPICYYTPQVVDVHLGNPRETYLFVSMAPHLTAILTTHALYLAGYSDGYGSFGSTFRKYDLHRHITPGIVADMQVSETSHILLLLKGGAVFENLPNSKYSIEATWRRIPSTIIGESPIRSIAYRSNQSVAVSYDGNLYVWQAYSTDSVFVTDGMRLVERLYDGIAQEVQYDATGTTLLRTYDGIFGDGVTLLNQLKFSGITVSEEDERGFNDPAMYVYLRFLREAKKRKATVSTDVAFDNYKKRRIETIL